MILKEAEVTSRDALSNPVVVLSSPVNFSFVTAEVMIGFLMASNVYKF